jgi:hypothetical protein
MAEEFIDFTQSSRRILLNPIVPLSVLDITCRTNERAEATILGKVFSGHIEIVEIIPIQFTEVHIRLCRVSSLTTRSTRKSSNPCSRSIPTWTSSEQLLLTLRSTLCRSRHCTASMLTKIQASKHKASSLHQ